MPRYAKKPIRVAGITWHPGIEEEPDEPYRVFTIWFGQHKGFTMTVYPVKLVGINRKGWEYRLNHQKEAHPDGKTCRWCKHGDDWDSLHETYTGRHARNKEQAMQWAKKTVNEWWN